MATVVASLKSTELHSLGVDLSSGARSKLEAAALNRLKQRYPTHGISKVEAEIIPSGKGVKFTITSTTELRSTEVKAALQ